MKHTPYHYNNDSNDKTALQSLGRGRQQEGNVLVQCAATYEGKALKPHRASLNLMITATLGHVDLTMEGCQSICDNRESVAVMPPRYN